MKILYIEDDIHLRRAISRKIEKAGYDVSQAGDGLEALAAMKDDIPDLALCDDQMPNMTGRELLREIRSNHPELAEVPFVLMSARSRRCHILSGLELGADDYLIKPVDIDLMLARIKSLTRLKSRFEQSKSREISKIYKELKRYNNQNDDFTALFDNLLQRLEHEYEECVRLKEQAVAMKAELLAEKDLNRELLARLNGMENTIDASMSRMRTIRRKVEETRKTMAGNTALSETLWKQLGDIGRSVEATIIPVEKFASFRARR